MTTVPDPGSKLIQITDCHLLADPGALHKRVSPRRTLQSVCDAVRKNHADAAALLLTGDLSQDGSTESYRQMVGMITPLTIRTFALAGNHDLAAAMQNSLPPVISLDKIATFGNWRVLLLNSVIESEVGGRLDSAELQWLQDQLTEYKEDYFIVALHHHPVLTGSLWMDRIGLENPQALEHLLTDNPRVRMLLHGHTHQAGCRFWKHIPCYGTPSSWRQFAAGSAFYRMDVLPPAYRVIELHNDGRHRSWVEFV